MFKGDHKIPHTFKNLLLCVYWVSEANFYVFRHLFWSKPSNLRKQFQNWWVRKSHVSVPRVCFLKWALFCGTKTMKLFAVMVHRHMIFIICRTGHSSKSQKFITTLIIPSPYLSAEQYTLCNAISLNLLYNTLSGWGKKYSHMNSRLWKMSE